MPGAEHRGKHIAGWGCSIALLAMAVPMTARHVLSQDRPASSGAGAETDAQDRQTEPAGIAVALPRGKKLILTDGSFQIVREYERQGGRVRYYSVERSSWEEIPAEMVDWAATEKADAEAAASQKEMLDRIHATATAELATTINTGSSLQVGSGVFLPDSPGFYVLDGQNILGLIQVEATARLDKGRAVLKGLSGIPFISSKQIVEVAGKQAKIRLHTGEPEFYIRTNDGRAPQLTLVRADVTGDKRHVTTIVTDMVGTTKYDQKEIPVLTSEAARGVERMVMSTKLDPGEYALLETTKEGLSLYVWEFGVDRGDARPQPASKALPAKTPSK
jgi:hypothetical protein